MFFGVFARRGFQKQHNDRCVTVFSASNYCGDGGSEYPVPKDAAFLSGIIHN